MENTFIKKLDNASTDYYKLCVLLNILDRPDAKKILKEIFSSLIKRDYYAFLGEHIFKFFLVHKELFKEEILYIMSTNMPKSLILSLDNVMDIITIDGGIEEVLKHFDQVNIRSQKLINDLTLYIMNNRPDLFSSFVAAVMKTKEDQTIHHFFVTIVTNDIDFDYNLILEALRKWKEGEYDDSFSEMPHTMVDYMFWSEKLKVFLSNNFEELFNLEKSKKIRFLEALIPYLPKEIAEKYDYLLKIIKASILPKHCEECLNILLANHKGNWIKDYIGDKSVVSFNERMGTTAEVFRVGEKQILKIAQAKHDEESEREHFLLGPTEQLIIKDSLEKPILYVEKQKLFLQTHKGRALNQEDLDHYFEELERCDMEINDPHCHARDFDNFGFLDDYHEATLVGVNSYEELPDWFKERPVVLLDIDLVRKKSKKETRKIG